MSGLRGGHSGGDIHLGRGNAVKILARALYGLADDVDYVLGSIQGGNLHNAIAREAHAVIGIDPSDREPVEMCIRDSSYIYKVSIFRTDHASAASTTGSALGLRGGKLISWIAPVGHLSLIHI